MITAATAAQRLSPRLITTAPITRSTIPMSEAAQIQNSSIGLPCRSSSGTMSMPLCSILNG